MPKYSRFEGAISLTSLEIAQQLNKEHKHFMRDIRLVMERKKIAMLDKFKSQYRDSYKRKQTMYTINRQIYTGLLQHYKETDLERYAVLDDYIAHKNQEYDDKLTKLVDKFMSKWQ